MAVGSEMPTDVHNHQLYLASDFAALPLDTEQLAV